MLPFADIELFRFNFVRKSLANSESLYYNYREIDPWFQMFPYLGSLLRYIT